MCLRVAVSDNMMDTWMFHISGPDKILIEPKKRKEKKILKSLQAGNQLQTAGWDTTPQSSRIRSRTPDLIKTRSWILRWMCFEIWLGPPDQAVPFSGERRHDGTVCPCLSGDIKVLSTVYWPFCSFPDNGPISQQSAAGRRTQRSGTFKWHLKFSCVKLNCLTGSPPQTADLQVNLICDRSWLKTFLFQIQPRGRSFVKTCGRYQTRLSSV